MRIFPVLCLSGLHDIGSDWLLELIVEAFPSPADRPPAKVILNGKEIERKARIPSPPRRLCSRPRPILFPGRITYFKVLSGLIKNDAHLFNGTRGTEERLAHIGCRWQDSYTCK